MVCRGYLQALEERNALRELRAVTGYTGSGAVQIRTPAGAVADARTGPPSRVVHSGGSVIGDVDSGIMHKAEIPDAYRQHLFAVAAQGSPPIWFELEMLSGQQFAIGRRRSPRREACCRRTPQMGGGSPARRERPIRRSMCWW